MTTRQKIIHLLAAAALLSSVGTLCAQKAKGIKTANLKGADLDLMQQHDPASELENFELLEGYQANLFAADPMLANPVHMHWDSRGRLWVACSWSYPQLKPGDIPDDKIIILEDTDGDGAADTSTVFADGLYLPTGIELANGGCYVGQSPDVFFLKDTDGDDVADVKELALTGFGIEDSHHSISAWRRGPGGWIYFQEGIFLHAQVETQYGVLRNFNGGVYQFNPRTQELRVFCTGTGGNPWGHVFDRWGQSFMVNNPRIMYLSPASGNCGDKLQVKPLISTEKQCGGDLASGTHVGDDLRGQLMSGRFKSRAVIRYEFIEKGAGYSANVLKPLMSSRHPNFRPVDVKMGPDGAVYVADWYNSIINHAQHDFRDPRRDHEHGRIWRITHKERALVEKPKLVGASIEELVEVLRSPQDWNRHQARKELSERDPDKVLAAAEAWVDALDDNLSDYDHHLVEAMWACQNVERVSEKILKRVLAAKDGHARSAGARVIRYWHSELSDPIAMLAQAAGDPFPRTRMEGVLSAGFVPRAEAFAAALHSLDHPGDPVLDLALPQTMKALAGHWRPAMEAGTLKFAKASHREFAEQGAGIGFDLRLAAFLKEASPSQKNIDTIREQLPKVGTEREIRMVLNALTKGAIPRSRDASIVLLESLGELAGERPSRSSKRRITGLKSLLSNADDGIAVAAAGVLGDWRAAGANLVALVEDDTRSAVVRRAAAEAYSKVGDPQAMETLANLAKSEEIGTRYAALVGMAHADFNLGVTAAAQAFAEDPAGEDPVPILLAILQNRKGKRALTDALEGVELHSSVVASVNEFHRNTGRLPATVAKLFQVEPSAESLSAKLLAEKPSQLTADVEQHGDAARGEMVYRRKALACTSCHAIGSAGPSIGPNLVAVGAAATTDYMVESILKPNAAIAEHYENRLFTLNDGSVRMGVVTFKSEKEVVFRDSAQAGKELRLAAADIAKEQALPSLMPAGLADQLSSREEFLDLAKFLSELGKPGPFANDESPVLRKWRVMAAPADGSIPDDSVAAWLPAYSKVGGDLPAEELAIGDSVLARGFVNIQVPGLVHLAVNSTEGLTVWIDQTRVEAPSAAIRFESGRHALTFAVDRVQRGDEGLRVELKAADESVKFQVEGGM